MRRPWIKIETATPDKPEICTIATMLRMDPDTVLGKLVRLWAWIELNRVPANDLGVTKEFIDKLVGRRGFAAAMISAQWLCEDDGRLGMRNLERHNGGEAKVRALTAARVAAHRQRKLRQMAATESEPVRLPTPAAVQEPSPQMPASEIASTSPDSEVTEAPFIPEPTPVAATPTPSEPEPGMEAIKPRGRGRSRAVEDSSDQPMLF